MEIYSLGWLGHSCSFQEFMLLRQKTQLQLQIRNI